MTNPTSLSRHATPRLVLALLALSAVLALVVAPPAIATEGEEAPASTEAPAEGGNAAAGEAENTKLTISDNPHDQFGLILFGLMGLAALAMGANAVKQLRGERPQADGKIRWR